ncbi:MAG: hypothetical protein ACI8YQ_003032 [Polaribacter sp.]|jgi:hypothetical protein
MMILFHKMKPIRETQLCCHGEMSVIMAEKVSRGESMVVEGWYFVSSGEVKMDR